MCRLPGMLPERHRRAGQVACASLDDLVGTSEQRRGDCKAKSLGGLETDGEDVVCRLLHRQVARLRPAEDTVDEGGSMAKCEMGVRLERTIAQQATSLGKLTVSVGRSQPVLQRPLRQRFHYAR